jgi:hypothetical protein
VELRDFPPAYSKIQGDLERLSRTVTPSYVSITQQMDRALKPVYTQHLEMARAVERAGSTMSLVGKIVDANMKAQRLIDNVSVSTKLLQDMSGIHRTKRCRRASGGNQAVNEQRCLPVDGHRARVFQDRF